MTERSGPTVREAAEELLERTDRTLLAIHGGEVKANDEEYWTFCGFRHALVWVLSYRDGDSEVKTREAHLSEG